MECFDLTIDSHVAHLVLKRGEAMNTMHPLFWRELDAVLTELHKKANARALVISSTGKHFSAGMDLSVFSGDLTMDDSTPECRAAMVDALLELQSTFNKLESLRMPVIVAIQGGCIGGALDMVTACCIRYASADAFFCVQEINIGMVADVGSLQRLPKLVPMAVVKELAYTGRRMNATRAAEVGLVNAVFADAATTLQAAMACAAEIAAKPPIAIWGTKQALHYAQDHSVADSLQHMGVLQAGIWSNTHVREAVAAARDERAGEFPALAAIKGFGN